MLWFGFKSLLGSGTDILGVTMEWYKDKWEEET
jgi:hypothetical protein